VRTRFGCAAKIKSSRISKRTALQKENGRPIWEQAAYSELTEQRFAQLGGICVFSPLRTGL